jgi:hypothetical protein
MSDFNIYYFFLLISIFLFIINRVDCGHKDYIYYICKHYSPKRNLYTEEELIDLFEHNMIRYFDTKQMNNLDYYIFLETYTAEHIVFLLNEDVRSNDPFIKVRIEAKICKIINFYNNLYEDYDLFTIGLIQRMVLVILETYLDMYNVSVKINNLFKSDKYLQECYHIFCKNQEKIDLNNDIPNFKQETIHGFYNLIKDTDVFQFNE